MAISIRGNYFTLVDKIKTHTTDTKGTTAQIGYNINVCIRFVVWTYVNNIAYVQFVYVYEMTYKSNLLQFKSRYA